MGGFHRQTLLIECCGHAILLSTLCGLTVRRGQMTSAIYVPSRFFSTLRSGLLFNFEEVNGYTYVAAQLAASIGSWLSEDFLPRFTFSDLLIADRKGEDGRHCNRLI